MTSLALRYVLLAAAVLVLNFLLPRLLPGDPLAATAEGGLSGALPALTSQQQAQLRVTYHLDQPLASQFASYVVDLARGDLGWSISRAAPVSQLIGLHWFPLQGGETLFAPPGQAWLATLGDRIVHLALPAASLVVANLAAFVLLSRGAIRGVLAEPYLATARAKGLGEWRVALRHA